MDKKKQQKDEIFRLSGLEVEFKYGKKEPLKPMQRIDTNNQKFVLLNYADNKVMKWAKRGNKFRFGNACFINKTTSEVSFFFKLTTNLEKQIVFKFYVTKNLHLIEIKENTCKSLLNNKEIAY